MIQKRHGLERQLCRLGEIIVRVVDVGGDVQCGTTPV